MKNFDLFELFGTTIYDQKIDLLTNRFTINLISPSDKGDIYYEAVFRGVEDLLYKNPKCYYSTYAELTEIHIEKKDDLYNVFIEIWSSELEINCKDYEIKLVAEEKN